MKTISRISAFIAFVICITLNACSEDPGVQDESISLKEFDTINFEPSMKGWELYSWPEGNDFNHSLLGGTNRLKTYDEVKTNKFIVNGTDSLKMLLARLPEGEHIHWIGRDWLERCWGNQPYGDLMVPASMIVNEIENFCAEHGLELAVSEN